jgi:predicted alpha/beta-hydrolase family hydrolase
MTAVAIRVTRYACPYCHRSRSKRDAAEAHVARCFRNPAAQGCKTCASYQMAEGGSHLTGYPGCGESCEAALDISAGLRTGCELWERQP